MGTVWTILLILCTITSILAHSWVACTDYKEENGVFYDAAKCNGFPRAWKNYNPTAPFGTDFGYNFQGKGCREKITAEDNYSGQYPSSIYTVGQKVCLAWPPKNHVAAKCANIYIPDGGTQIWYSSDGDATWSLLEDWGKFEIPATDNPTDKIRKGYQNCPDFCNNNDKALCTGCFTAPTTPGSYSFQWRWVFNPGDPYITCWDAQVQNSLTPSQQNRTIPHTVSTTSASTTTTSTTSTQTQPNQPSSPLNNNPSPPLSFIDDTISSVDGYNGVIALLVVILLLLIVMAALLAAGVYILWKNLKL